MGWVWVSAQSHPNRESDFLAVLGGAALGTIVGATVGAIVAESKAPPLGQRR